MVMDFRTFPDPSASKHLAKKRSQSQIYPLTYAQVRFGHLKKYIYFLNISCVLMQPIESSAFLLNEAKTILYLFPLLSLHHDDS